LEADHRGINKFESNTDPNYVRVLDKLKGLVDSAPDILKRGTPPSIAAGGEPLAGGYIHRTASNKGFRIIPYS